MSVQYDWNKPVMMRDEGGICNRKEALRYKIRATSGANLMNLKIATTTASFIALTCAAVSFPCQRTHRVSPEEMVLKADVIVRARAERLVHPASIPHSSDPDSTVQFKVLETIRGEMPSDHFELRGALVNADDFNDMESPYNFVRPDGRKGSCYATSYRAGAQFLLMLKKAERGFTVEWYPLGPTNEQLHSTDDPWLIWVRAQARQSVSGEIGPTHQSDQLVLAENRPRRNLFD
jgi:hypothetical protein